MVENLVGALFGIALALVVFGPLILWWNAASAKAKADRYLAPRIAAERDRKERQRMDEFLDH